MIEKDRRLVLCAIEELWWTARSLFPVDRIQKRNMRFVGHQFDASIEQFTNRDAHSQNPLLLKQLHHAAIGGKAMQRGSGRRQTPFWSGVRFWRLLTTATAAIGFGNGLEPMVQAMQRFAANRETDLDNNHQ
jgi:hypothetical protein